MNTPLISIIMACYNQTTYISEAIDSLLCQTVHNREAIIIDNGSTDNIKSVLQTYRQNNNLSSVILHIGFDAKKAVRNLTGIGNYSRRCINALADSVQIFLFTTGKGKETATTQLTEHATFIYPPHILRLGLLRELWRNLLICFSIKRTNIDIYHGLSNELPFGIQYAGCKSIVTIHDLIFIHHPHTYSLLQRYILKWKTLHACKVADRVIAISQQTKHDLMKLYHVPEEKISVVYQSVNIPLFSQQIADSQILAIKEQYNLPQRYILCVGTIERRKNQLTVLKAMSLLPHDIHLVLVGKESKHGKTTYQKEIEHYASANNLSYRLHILNHVSNQELPMLYQGASVFTFMSTYEGFGIPIVEALLSRVPVIAATGSCLEEAGGPHSIYIPSYSWTQLAEAVKRIMSSPLLRTQITDNGWKYAQQFSDKQLSRNLQRIYNELYHTN